MRVMNARFQTSATLHPPLYQGFPGLVELLRWESSLSSPRASVHTRNRKQQEADGFLQPVCLQFLVRRFKLSEILPVNSCVVLTDKPRCSTFIASSFLPSFS